MSLPKECPIGVTPQRRKSAKKDLEGPVVKACLKYLYDHPNVMYVERRNTGMAFFEGGGAVRFGAKGTADIWCLVEMDVGSVGDQVSVLQHIEIECKRADGKGRLSVSQKKFQTFCADVGISYLVVKSVEELIAGLQKICS